MVMHKIQCRTLFDITKTDVRHQFSADALPFRDATGRQIANHRDWMLSRNQQRNWETLVQLLSLRLQPQDITSPALVREHTLWWSFEFTIENPSVLSVDDRPYGQIEQDCAMVPMLIGLTEQVKITPMLIPGINIVFESANL